MRVKMSKQPPTAPTTSAVGPCPIVIQIVGRPGTGSLHSTIAPPDRPPTVIQEHHMPHLDKNQQNRGSDQPGHPLSLIRVFAVH